MEMAGRSEKPVLGASGLDVGAGEKLIKLGVTEVVWVVGADEAGEVVKPKPEGVAGTEAEVVAAAEGKVYAGGASDFGMVAFGAAAAGAGPNENPPAAFSGALDSTGAAVGFVGVWKLNVALLSVGLVGVPKLNPVDDFGGSLGVDTTGFGGSILPKPGSLIGSLIKAAIPLALGMVTSGFFSSIFAGGGTASTVSFATL